MKKIKKTYKDWLISKTKLENVFKIKPSVFKDFRGEYIETYNKEFLLSKKIRLNFVQDDISISKKNVLRGIHGDNKTWKLVSCLFGKFYLIVVNNKKNSKGYMKWQSFMLSSKNRQQILIPPGYGNGHLVLTQKAIFSYKQTTYYDPRSQFTIKWNDEKYKFSWPTKKPILSKRDT